MKKVYILLVLCLSILTIGCEKEKTFIFNQDYDEVYTKTVQYIYLKGWSIEYQNKEAKIIRAILSSQSNTYGSGIINNSSIGMVAGTRNKSDMITLAFNSEPGKTTVIVRTNSQDNSVFWDQEATIKEYYDYIIQGIL